MPVLDPRCLKPGQLIALDQFGTPVAANSDIGDDWVSRLARGSGWTAAVAGLALVALAVDARQRPARSPPRPRRRRPSGRTPYVRRWTLPSWRPGLPRGRDRSGLPQAPPSAGAAATEKAQKVAALAARLSPCVVTWSSDDATGASEAAASVLRGDDGDRAGEHPGDDPSKDSTRRPARASTAAGRPVITEDMLHTVLRRRANGESVEQIQPGLIIPTGKRDIQPPASRASTRRSPSTRSRRRTPKPSPRRTPASPIGEPDAERSGRPTSRPRPASRATFSAAFTRNYSRHCCRSTVSPPFDRPRSALPHRGRR
ncbi:hypothetical protein SGLAM104S_00017 [Streptomyces glaucescens]